MEPSIVPFWKTLSLTTPVVSYNGARIGVPGQPPLHEAWLTQPVVDVMLQIRQQTGIHLNLYIDDQYHVFSETPMARWYADHFQVPYRLLPDSSPWPRDRVTKILAIVEEDELDNTLALFHRHVGDITSLTTSSRRFVEVLPSNTHKGHALKRLSEHTGIPLPHWAAAGDGRNDLEMIQTAGFGIAIENGHESLRSSADWVIPPLSGAGLPLLKRRLLSLPGKDQG